MKVKRSKTYKRYSNLYQTVFGFRPPFQILVDGTLIVEALRRRINLSDQLTKIFHAPIKLLVTACVIAEMEKIRDEFLSQLKSSNQPANDKDQKQEEDAVLKEKVDVLSEGIRYARKQCDFRNCPHTLPDSSSSKADSKFPQENAQEKQKKQELVTAHECLRAMIQKSAKYCVGSQDYRVRDELRLLPGIPLIYISKSVLLLESPSDATNAKVKEIEIAKTMPEQFEKEVLQAMGRKRKSRAVGSGPIMIKKKKKEPNPLSCKKKKPKQQVKTTGKSS